MAEVASPHEVFHIGQYLKFHDELVVVNKVWDDWYLNIRGTDWPRSLCYPCCYFCTDNNPELLKQLGMQ